MRLCDHEIMKPRGYEVMKYVVMGFCGYEVRRQRGYGVMGL